jgi:hypothetical protein
MSGHLPAQSRKDQSDHPVAPKRGHINQTGSWTIAPQFDWVGNVFADRALLVLNVKMALIDRRGAVYGRKSNAGLPLVSLALMGP